MTPEQFAEFRRTVLEMDTVEATTVLPAVLHQVSPDSRLGVLHNVLSVLLQSGAGNDAHTLRMMRGDIDLRLRLLEGVSS